MNKRMRLLLLIVAMLAGLRVVALPWLQWRESQIESLQLAQHQMSKLSGIQHAEADLKEQQATLRVAAQDLADRLGRYDDASKLKLAIFQTLQDQAKHLGLEQTSFAWGLQMPDSATGLFRVQASLQLIGTLAQHAQLTFWLEKTYPGLRIRSLRWTEMSRMRGKGMAAMDLELELYADVLT